MANEALIRSNLQIRKTLSATDGTIILDYSSRPTAFTADVSGNLGPTPGAFVASTAGTDVDLSALTIPGLCRFMHLGTANFVEVGIWDPEGVRFYPMLELLPGDSFIVRLARNIEEEFGTGDPGTATAGANTNRMRFKAISAAVNVLVEAFEK